MRVSNVPDATTKRREVGRQDCASTYFFSISIPASPSFSATRMVGLESEAMGVAMTAEQGGQGSQGVSDGLSRSLAGKLRGTNI